MMKTKIMQPTRRLIVTEMRRERASIVCFPFLSVHVVKVNAFCSTLYFLPVQLLPQKLSGKPPVYVESREMTSSLFSFLFFPFFFPLAGQTSAAAPVIRSVRHIH